MIKRTPDIPLLVFVIIAVLLVSGLAANSYISNKQGPGGVLGKTDHHDGGDTLKDKDELERPEQNKQNLRDEKENKSKEETKKRRKEPKEEKRETAEEKKEEAKSEAKKENVKLRIEPEDIEIQPLQKQKFKAFVEKDEDGKKIKVDEKQIKWKIPKGGGTIGQDGELQAWDLPGKYEVEGEYQDQTAVTSVKIKPLPLSGEEPVATVKPSGKVESSSPRRHVSPTGSKEEEEKEEKEKVAEGEAVAQPTIPYSTEPEREITPKEAKKEKAAKKPKHSFRYLEDETKQCLKFVLGEEEYRRYFDPDGERRDPGELKKVKPAVDRCFKISRKPDFDNETEKCLVERLGEKRYEWIAGQVAPPTRKELYAASGCFTEPRYVTYKPQEDISEFSRSCLEVKFGRKRYRELIDKKAVPTNEELTQGRECFNIEENIARPPLIIESTDENASCLKGVLGEERYQAIYGQGQNPSADEVNAAKVCFEKAEDSQEVFLPPPPEQVAFIPESKQDSQIETIDVGIQETRVVIQLRGKAEPNTTVDIYIFSEPIVVTTQTDANGNWFYELNYHLPEGEHKAYAVVHHPEKGLVKSEVLAFNVALAAEPVAGVEIPVPQIEVVHSPRRDLTRIYLWMALIIVNLGGALLIAFQFIRLKNKNLS